MMIPAAWWLRRPTPYSLNPQRVLVTVFDNQTGDPRLDPIGRMAADWIARGLMDHRRVEVVSTATFLLAGNDATERRIRELAQETGAGTVVSGTYYLDGGVLRLQAQITDAARGRLLHTLGPIGVPVDSATLAAELLRQRMAAVLAARFDFSHELREITASGQPPTYAAYVAYLEGAELFFRNQIPRAIERFEQAWVLDTTFYLPQLYNALMYWNLDLLAEMDSVVHDLSPRRDRFSPLERLWLEHFEALIAGDNELALRTIRQMAEVAPGSWLGGQSALALMTNRPREALHALLQADLERGFLRNWGYYWFLRTTARHMLGQHRQELAEARRARSQQPELLRSRFAELRALAALGRLRELERLLEQSRLLPADPEWTPADLLRSTAAELRAHGHMDAAERALQDALGWYLGRPADEQPHHRAALASTLYEARRWDEARALLEELVSEQPEDLAYLGHLGALAVRRGERAEAERISATLAASTKPYLRGAHTLWRARIAALLGEREQALALLHESLAQGQTFLLRLHTDADLDPLRDYPPFRELLRPKA